MIARVILLAAAAFTCLTTPAGAAEILAPLNGDNVSSQPSFVVDYTQGTLEVELARTPDVLTDGPSIGGFVEPVRSGFMLVGLNGQPPGTAQWLNLPIAAGQYYWHARPDDYATEIERDFRPDPWSPTRVFVVRDEPPVIEGWTLRTRRVSRRLCGQRSRYRFGYIISGTIRWSDNADRPRGDYTLTLRHVSGKAVRFTGRLDLTSQEYTHLLCTNVGRARAELRIMDPWGNVTMGRAKQVRLR